MKLFLSVFLGAISTFAIAQTLTVDGTVEKKLTLTLAEFQKLESTKVRAKDKEGREHEYKGVTLNSLLKAAGTTLGKDLRGDNLLKVVVVKATDGYQCLFSLAEIDDDMGAASVLIATEVDGKVLDKSEGPFRLVVPDDKKLTRWVRQVATITVTTSR